MNSSNAPLYSKHGDLNVTERPQAVRLHSLNSITDSTDNNAALEVTTNSLADKARSLIDDDKIFHEDKPTVVTLPDAADIDNNTMLDSNTDSAAAHPLETITDELYTDAKANPPESTPTVLAETPLADTSTTTTSVELAGTEARLDNPGQHLRYLREQKGLSLQYVADNLYLGMNVIEALEADDYARLPSPIFVQGYINNYARLLEVDAAPILATYKNMSTDTTPPPLTQVKQKTQVTHYKPTTKRTRVANGNGHPHDSAWLPFLGIGVFIGLALLGLVWLIYPQSGEFLVSPTQLSLGNNEDSVSMQQGVSQPLSLSASEAALSLSNTSALSQEGETVGDYTPPVEGIIGDDEQVAQPLSLQPPEAIALSLADNAVVESQANASETAATTEPLEGDTPQPQQVTVNYTSAAAWTRVVDGSGKKLFEGTKQAGDSLILTGEPPFTLRFGVMRGVQVEYQGEVHNAVNSPLRDGKNLILGQ